MSEINCLNITAGYEKPIFHNLSISLKSPNFLAVIGRNGSGKSSLVKCIAQQLPYQGSILWDGQSLSSLKVKDRSSILSYLQQKNEISLPINVKDLIVMGRYGQGGAFRNYEEEDYEVVNKCLAQLGIGHFGNKLVQNLSGGEQQLVWICQALVQDCPLIIFDEPDQFLDLANKKRFFDLIKELSRSKLIIAISHDLENIKKIPGQFINMSESKPVLRPIDEEEINQARSLLEKF